MSSIFLTDNQLYAAKAEATPGDAETLLPSDYNLMPTRAEITTLEVEYTDTSKYVTGDHTHDLVQPKTAKITIETDFEARVPVYTATGTSGSPTFSLNYPMEKKLNGAGCAVIPVTPSDDLVTPGYVKINPTKLYDCATTTEALYDVVSCEGVGVTKGIEYKAKGASSTLVFDAPAVGEPLYMKFAAQGAVADVAEISPVPVIDDTALLISETPRWRNATVEITELSLDGSPLTPPATPREVCSNSFNLDTGNVLSEIGCQTDEFGIKQYIITGKDALLKITPLLEKISDYDWWNALNKASVYGITVTFYEDSAKTIPLGVITVPRAQMITLTGSDDSGKRRQEQTFRCLRNTQGATPDDKETVWEVVLVAETEDQTTP